MQRDFLVHFERCEVDPLTQNLQKIIQSTSEKQLEVLIRSSQNSSGECEPNDDPLLNSLSKAQILAFGCVFRLLLLQETLHQWFTCDQLIALVESCRMPNFAPDIQLKVLQQFQQLLSQILPETLQGIHESIKKSTDQGREANSAIFHLLESCQDQALLNQPLSRLLTTDLETMMHIHEYFPKLQPVQVVQLVRLMQFENQWNLLELRQLLSPDQKGWMGLQTMLNESKDEDEDEMMDDSEANQFSLSILEQPPDRTVYKRCLKPNPTVFVKSTQKPLLHSGETLCVVPSLYRFDTNQPVLFLTGNSSSPTSVGSSVCFKRLKVTKTSKQLDDTLFYLRFELRKTDGHKQSEALAYVHSKPFFVVSHSSLLAAPTPSAASISEIVPAAGSTRGGTRVVILGSNFEDTPSLIVKFDNIIVTPEFHGAGTLICVTPSHFPGQVEVIVSTNPKDQSKSGSGWFTFEDATEDDESGQTQSIHNSRPAWFDDEGMENLLNTLGNSDIVDELLQSGFHPYTPLHYAAASGNYQAVEGLLRTGKISVDIQDKYGNNALYWALRNGHERLLEVFIRYGINLNSQNQLGNTLLHLASTISAQLLAKLVYLGAWINIPNGNGVLPLHAAASCGNINGVKVLLRCGAHINDDDIEGDTCLHFAIRENQVDMVELLIQEGIDVNLQNEDGETPLHLAVSLHSSDITEMILSSGRCNLSLKDCTGATPLLSAVERGYPSSAIENLIQSSGNNINLENHLGLSPLQIASSSKQSTLENLLMNYGAKLPQSSHISTTFTFSSYPLSPMVSN